MMDMGSGTTMPMATGTMTMTMPMASSTAMPAGGMSGGGMSGGGMSSGGMSGGSGMSMSMAEMQMTFFEGFQTSLFTTTWTPTTTGQYAGTCIFLIALASILRLLLALKPIMEDRFWRNNVTYESEKQRLTSRGDAVEPGMAVVVVRRDIVGRWRGWRAGPAAARATYELIIGGAGYLLMLAVMTMNVGYFLSVLAGIWLGTFLLGGLAGGAATMPC